MEYVREGLEITYMFGNAGMGRVIENRKEISEIVSGLIEQAKLKNKRSMATFRGGRSEFISGVAALAGCLPDNDRLKPRLR